MASQNQHAYVKAGLRLDNLIRVGGINAFGGLELVTPIFVPSKPQLVAMPLGRIWLLMAEPVHNPRLAEHQLLAMQRARASLEIL